jgi:hypothetical protein
MQVGDAGKSECHSVMEWIGIQDLSHPKGEPTSHVRRNAFAGVTWQNEFENRKTGASL